jgi:hypothetical protein
VVSGTSPLRGVTRERDVRMRTSYLERLGRFRSFCCVAIVLDASAIVKIELPKENFGRLTAPQTPFTVSVAVEGSAL